MALVLVLTAGVVAGGAAWLAGEATYDRLQPKILATGGIPTIEEARAGDRAMKAAVTYRAAVAFGALGASLGLALGLAGGIVHRSARSGLIGAALGATLGGAAGFLATWLLMPIYFRFYDPDRDDLLLASLIQGAIAAAIGAAGGASFGFGDRGRIPRALVGGLLGGVAGVLIYELAGALAFPLDQTTKPISATPGTRLLGRILVTCLAAVGAAIGYGPTQDVDSRPAAT
jgi:hypothetical protein